MIFLLTEGNGTELFFTNIRQFAFTEGFSQTLQLFRIPDFQQGVLIQVPNIHLEETRTKSNIEIRFNAEDAVPWLVAEILLALRHIALRN